MCYMSVTMLRFGAETRHSKTLQGLSGPDPMAPVSYVTLGHKESTVTAEEANVGAGVPFGGTSRVYTQLRSTVAKRG